MSSATPILEARSLEKRYGATHALRDTSLRIHAGEVVALLGENGAGKSTLTKIIAGETAPDSGELLVDGKATRFRSAGDAIGAGISRVPQELQVFPHLSVHENLYSGHMPTSRSIIGLRGTDLNASRKLSAQLLQIVGIDLPLDARCGSLGFAQRQLVMLLRALTHDVRVLILDEPTAALEQQEVEILFSVVRALAARDVAIIYITHRLSELRAIASRVVVMRDGRIVSEVAPGQHDERRLAELMSGQMGADADRHADADESARKASALHAVLPRTEPGIDDASMPIRVEVMNRDVVIERGRVSGFSGLLGSGVETLLQDCFGTMNSRKMRHRSGKDVSAGFVSGERGQQVFYASSVRDNICAPHLDRFSSFGHFDARRARKLVVQLIRALDIRPADPDRPMNQLSGGNQQKVLFARWFMGALDMLMLAEPTAGVDVGAKALIQNLIADYRQQGGTVLLSSTEYGELIALCDSITPVIKGSLGTPATRGSGFDEHAIRQAIGAS